MVLGYWQGIGIALLYCFAGIICIIVIGSTCACIYIVCTMYICML